MSGQVDGSQSSKPQAIFVRSSSSPGKFTKMILNWVPPLLSMRRELLDKEKNPAWAEYMEGDYFAAWRGDQIVGTNSCLTSITATTNFMKSMLAGSAHLKCMTIRKQRLLYLTTAARMGQGAENTMPFAGRRLLRPMRNVVCWSKVSRVRQHC